MNFSSGSDAPRVFAKRTGIGICKVLAVNPTKNEINKIYGREVYKDEPEYIRTLDINGEKVTTALVSFLLSFSAEDNGGIDEMHFLTFRLRNEYETNRDNTKVHVIDKFGRTAWVTNEEFERHDVPIYKNGPARISKDYRKCYRGEERLITFMKAFESIIDVDTWNSNTKTWEMYSDPEKCYAYFSEDEIKQIASGNIKSLRDEIAKYPDKKVKVLIGIRKDPNDGREYTDIFDSAFMKERQESTKGIYRALNEEVANGRYANTKFIVQMGLTTLDDPVQPTAIPDKAPSISNMSSDVGFDDLPF